VAAVEHRLDDVAAEELRAAEDEDSHTLNLMARLYLVRHALVAPRADVPAPEWELTREGRAAAEELAARLPPVARVVSSPEPKAADTAAPIARASGVEVELDARLREVERPTGLHDDYAERVRRYLGGEPLDGWESRERARARVAAALDGVEGVAVSHGLAIALYLGYGFDEWRALRLPDVVEVA
jgi:broad specificity phosphatase PhoE